MVQRRDFRRNNNRFSRRSGGFFARSSLTTALIIINVIAFVFFLILIGLNSGMTNYVAVQPENVLQGKAVWTVFTSMFMHAGVFHLFVNMFSLFFLGRLIEKVIGRKRYLWFYLIAGIVGSLFFVLFAYIGQFVPRGDFVFGGMSDSAVGASGAIFGLLGLLAVLLPKKEVYLIVGPIVVIVLQFLFGAFIPEGISGVVNIIATILIFLMILAIFSPNSGFRKIAMPLKLPFWLTPIIAIVPLVLVGLFVKLPIGNTAHFGGLIVGLIYGAYLRKKYPKKVKLLNKILR
ncbi:MAG: rhomboid family intramembrane serine protease [Candidatus Pacearchaeota archaeon]|nr:rhomboid family intramembrane serine protease [Candidatus Pacearchaeota archaeon]